MYELSFYFLHTEGVNPSMADEHTSLLPQADPKKFYFLTKKKSSTSDKSKEGNTAGEKPAAELTVHPSQGRFSTHSISKLSS